MLPIKKLYIDSRWKSSNSKSDTDFSIQLPQNYHMPKNTVFYIDHVCLPVSWYSVQKNRNNMFYFKINTLSSSMFYAVEIDENNYKADTLSTVLANAINSKLSGIVTGKYNIDLNSLELSINSPNINLYIPTDDELVKSYNLKLPLNSVNNVLRNYSSNQVYTSTNPFISDYLDFFPIRNLYLISDNLGNHNTMTVSGECGIIKHISVSASYNQLIIDNQVLGADYLDCSNQNINLLKFRLVDAFGNTIDLNGNHWSFSIVFSKLSEEN
jgi:hypothetical protein